MLNKGLTKSVMLLIVSLTIASCSSSKKNTKVDSAPEPQVKKEAVIEAEMFSVTVEEIKKSGTTPQVIYFDTDSAKLTKESVSTLSNKVLPEAKNSRTKKVVIEAHCDERGSEAYNQKLSEKRAWAVKNYLVKNGVKVKIKTVGYGESKPVALGHDEESWSKNRRAITVSIKK